MFIHLLAKVARKKPIKRQLTLSKKYEDDMNTITFTKTEAPEWLLALWKEVDDKTSPAPIVIGGQNVVINPIAGPQQFYRLVH
jgi:hypothetical protein